MAPLTLLALGSLLFAQISCDRTPKVRETSSQTKSVDSESVEGMDIEGETVKEKHPKIESGLASVVEAAKASPTEALAYAQELGMKVSGDLIQVYIATHPAGAKNAIKAVDRAGGKVTRIGDDRRLIQAWVPMNALQNVANDKDVYFIRQPDMARVK